MAVEPTIHRLEVVNHNILVHDSALAGNIVQRISNLSTAVLAGEVEYLPGAAPVKFSPSEAEQDANELLGGALFDPNTNSVRDAVLKYRGGDDHLRLPAEWSAAAAISLHDEAQRHPGFRSSRKARSIYETDAGDLAWVTIPLLSRIHGRKVIRHLRAILNNATPNITR